MLPLRPVPAVAVNVQFGTVDTGKQAQARIHRHEAIVTSPYHQRLGLNFPQTRSEIRELFRVGFKALDKVFQVIASRQHVVQARFKQRFRQITSVIDENTHHFFEIFDSRLTVQPVQQFDAFGRHRGEQTHPAGTAAHQHQFAHALRPGQGERHGAVAAHRVTQQVNFLDI